MIVESAAMRVRAKAPKAYPLALFGALFAFLWHMQGREKENGDWQQRRSPERQTRGCDKSLLIDDLFPVAAFFLFSFLCLLS